MTTCFCNIFAIIGVVLFLFFRTNGNNSFKYFSGKIHTLTDHLLIHAIYINMALTASFYSWFIASILFFFNNFEVNN